MTQSEVIQELKSAVSPLFWDKAINVKMSTYGGVSDICVSNMFGIYERILWVDFIGIVSTRLRQVTLESAKAHLKLHQADWERANPEYARETPWVELSGTEIGAIFRISFADLMLFIFEDNLWQLIGNRLQVISYGYGADVESAKEEAFFSLIKHLKGEQP